MTLREPPPFTGNTSPVLDVSNFPNPHFTIMWVERFSRLWHSYMYSEFVVAHVPF